MKGYLIFPHQLFPELPLNNCDIYYLLEDPLFFSEFKFHKQKLIFHRASMKAYEARLKKNNLKVKYLSGSEIKDYKNLLTTLKADKISQLYFASVDDDWLNRNIKGLLQGAISFTELPHPTFLTSTDNIESYKPKGSFFYFHDFYIAQRKRLDILIKAGKPVGGKWSFDAENRSKLPAGTKLPKITWPKQNTFAKEGIEYVSQNFSNNPGHGSSCLYPTTRDEAIAWMDEFFESRFATFGDYEDAICEKESILFHSVLTPMLNVGLITPQEIIDRALKFKAPLNSQEGFIRQIIGWREFIRLIYHRLGRKQRTRNYLKNTRQLSAKFYDGSTGILPVDNSIKRVLDSAYCHHIERLMVLGNFMLLCDIDPDETYRWFMELFIDAYDWVMVPNVYGMSQYADGGLMTTKPYISGSAYVLKMSDYKKGPWCETWDGLYWRFIDKHYDLIKGNPRMSVMAGMRDKLDKSGKLTEKLKIAEKFLNSL
jgi:deoxyribodipyrimidine photolyase-related protein